MQFSDGRRGPSNNAVQRYNRTAKLISGGPLQIDPEQVRRNFSSLSDDALLELHREDLTELAVAFYDEEISKRGLIPHEESAGDPIAHGDLALEDHRDRGEPRRLFMNSVPWARQAVTVHTFHSAPEAEQAREALDASGVPNALAGDESGALRFNLMVPRASLEAAQRILEAEIFHPVFEDALERHFAVFGDDELLEMDRKLLPETSRAAYDAELEARGLGSPIPKTGRNSTSDQTDFMAAATLLGTEAEVGQRILAEAGIPCSLEDDDAPTPLDEYRSVRLMVRSSHYEDAARVLEDNAQKIIDAGRGDS